MYILVLSFKNGDVRYYGPFPSHARVGIYAAECERTFGESLARWHTANLVKPHGV